jgi:hypothetical protein
MFECDIGYLFYYYQPNVGLNHSTHQLLYRVNHVGEDDITLNMVQHNLFKGWNQLMLMDIGYSIWLDSPNVDLNHSLELCFWFTNPPRGRACVTRVSDIIGHRGHVWVGVGQTTRITRVSHTKLTFILLNPKVGTHGSEAFGLQLTRVTPTLELVRS